MTHETDHKKTAVNRLQSSTDEELLEMIADIDNFYRKEVAELAHQIAVSRGLISNYPGSEFKVITAGGRENGPLDVHLIKEM